MVTLFRMRSVSGRRRSNPLDFETLQKSLEASPFQRWLGVKLIGHDDTGIEVQIPWREELISNPSTKSAHGGILATLIDFVGFYSVLVAGGNPSATVDIRADYHRIATPGTLRARGNIIKLGSQFSSAETHIFSEADKLLASGRGTYLTAR